MKKAFTTAATLLLAFGVSTAQAHGVAEQRTNWLTERLDLTEEQQAQVNAIFAEAQEQREQLKAQAQEERKAAVERRKALRQQSNAIGEATRERLGAVLTEEQQSELTEMREGMKKRAILRRGMQGRKGGRMNRQHGMNSHGGMRGRAEMGRRMIQRARKHEQEQAEAPAAEE